METEKAGAAAGDSNAGGQKEQLAELALLPGEEGQAGGAGQDFSPGPGGSGGGKSGQGSAETGAMLGVLVSTVCTVVAARRGDHWILRPEEAESVGQAAGAVLDKYVPNVEAGPEFALVMVCLTVFGPRAMADIQMQGQGGNAAEQGKQGKDGHKSADKA